MKTVNLIKKNLAAIQKQWFERVIATYPPDTCKFLKGCEDSFSNPVGNMTFNGIKGILDELTGEMRSEEIKSHLDPIIRIRAVQNFTSSQAVGFVFFLKSIIRNIVKSSEGIELSGGIELYDVLAMESRIDEIGLMAFDIFMGCKETIYNLKANEIRNRSFAALQRAGLIDQMPVYESEKRADSGKNAVQ